MENAESGLARPLLENTKHGYGGEVSDTTPNKQRAISSMCRAAMIADSGLIPEWRTKEKAGDVRLKSSEGWSLSVTQKSALHDTQHHGATSYRSYTLHVKFWIAQLKVNRITLSLWRMGRGETESKDGRTPYPSAPDEMRKAGFFHTFIPHAGSLASAEERQE